ncbi:MAG: coenzyme PQQ synthesis protein c [Candidatus Peregrinibacteria bacterium Greene0416_19]|nr:MAG: coenzyme PQQ synthesis protein c [Candidatus Peregrinibacteria bacterium Greene0416_19]
MIALSSLDSIISTKSLLKHPFYQKWSKGELTLDDLRVYAKEYFHLVERIPGIVDRVRDRVTDPSFKAGIEHNAEEEREHVELWKRFAGSLGIPAGELMSYEPSHTVKDAVASMEALAERGLEEGITAMYALELELPKIAVTKKQGLCDFYGLTSEDAHIYFDEHLKEEEHLKVWRSQPVSDRAAATAEACVAAQNRVLDGVCERCGIPMDC